MNGEAPGALPLSPAFLEGLVAPLFAAPARTRRAVALLGAPLALACATRLASPALDLDALRRAAQLEAIGAKRERAAILAFGERLARAGIAFVALKGLATSLALYPRPYLRRTPDADLLFRARDLPRLVELLSREGFATRLDPQTVRRWGALTRASFAPVEPPDGAFLLDVHRLVDDMPAARGLPTEAVFARAQTLPDGPPWLKVPCREHMVVLLVLNAFRDLYEPRGLKGFFDAHLLLAEAQPDWAEIGRLAVKGRFVRRLLFYRELLLALGAAERLPPLAGPALGRPAARLARRIAQNYRTLECLALPDPLKLRLEFALYDSAFTALARNLHRLVRVFAPARHELEGLPVVPFEEGPEVRGRAGRHPG